MAATSQIEALKRRLASLNAERLAAVEHLAKLEAASATDQGAPTPEPTIVAATSSASAKVGLFRQLFRGREDVFARRWDNPKTGRSGFAPACHNEWVRGVCGKPRVRCGECSHQAFLPLVTKLFAGICRESMRDGGMNS